MKTLLAITFGLLLGASTVVSAAPRDHDGGHDGHRGGGGYHGSDNYQHGGGYQGQNHHGGGWNNDHHGGGNHQGNWGGYGGYSYRDNYRGHHGYGYTDYRYRGGAHYNYYPRNYARSWNIGYRLPSNYWGPSYYVDYRTYGLVAPGYGYRWVRVGNDALLIAIATGLIADIAYDQCD